MALPLYIIVRIKDKKVMERTFDEDRYEHYNHNKFVCIKTYAYTFQLI